MAKKVKEEVVGSSKLAAALESLNKKYGVGSVLTLDTKPNTDYNVISSGSIGLDWVALGVGGFVEGKLYELVGWEGVGKSTICGHAAAECQKKGGKVAYIDGEHAVDKNYFEALGVDTSKMLIAQPSSGEEGFNIAMELIETGEINLVIIDSDSSLIPQAVVDGDVGDSSIGKKARLNSNAYPKLKSVLSKNNVCVIVISQYREKIGVMFGDPRTTQGGHALKFYADVRIEISRTAAKDGDVTYGNITKLKAIKNKMSPPFRLTQFEVLFGKGIDKLGEIMQLASDFEIARKHGKVMTYKETKYDLEEFKKMLIEDPKFFDKLRTDIISKIQETPIELEDENQD
jgi:recombination protein RecA